jgi:poly-gamma-glutamate capsule biosynthesis protein CapA/YwtB (metallophosphatase superfamily)
MPRCSQDERTKFVAAAKTSFPLAAAALFFCCVVAASLPFARVGLAAQGPSSRVSYPQEISRVTFAVAGDVIPHEAVVESAHAAQAQTTSSAPASNTSSVQDTGASNSTAPNDHAGWDALFTGVADIFHRADFGFVNLETPVAPKHSLGSRPFQFDAPVALLESLKASGVKVVSFANNHVLDQDYLGFDETLHHLREQGLSFVGSGPTADDAWKPLILEKNGIRVGWLGMTRWLNGRRNPQKDSDPHVAFFPYPGESDGAPGRDESGVLEAVKAARAQCDLLLISIHWGIEYAPAPRPEDVDMAHKMLEAGASAVIGHHPHVLQPIETYVTQDHRKTIIFFSLGNFLSNQSASYAPGLMPDKTAEPRDSIMAMFAVVKKDYGPTGIQFEMADVGILPLWTENNRLQLHSGDAKSPSIHPVLMDREIPRLQAQLDLLNQMGPQLSNGQKQEFLQLSNQLAMLKHQRELLLGRTGDEYVVAPPAP